MKDSTNAIKWRFLEQTVTEAFPKIERLPEEAVNTAEKHLADVLSLALKHSKEQAAIVVFDSQCPLALALTEAYRRCLPSATFIDFFSLTPTEIKAAFDTLAPYDLVVLIQSTSFRLDAFRIRVELFKQSLKVIEHPHLARMNGLEAIYYIESLAYDPNYYHSVGHALKNRIDNAQRGIVDSGGERLVFSCPFEPAKLNIGDYSGMNNIGGQFPIGEVFTEARDLEAVNGRVRIFVFGDNTFSVNILEKPLTLVVNKGRVVDALDSTPEFDQVLATIHADEGEVWLRELGFGMNRSFSRERTVTDIGTYERMCGIHLSLGAKHGVYKKPQIKRAASWHHVDVFAVTELVYLDETVVYQNGAWLV
jgi:aminopeptidase